ncbi:retrovirus-related pol polyprotein from transposon TNT 1-94 [Tanacetum coccineum]
MVKSNARCSAILQYELLPKEKDTGNFILPCAIGTTTVSNALADLGASIIIMPFSLFKWLGLGNPKPINMVIEMANRSMQSPKGIVENVLVKINNFIFPVDFIILDIIEDDKVLIILGRPMLATAHARIDVFGKKISLEVGSARLNDNSSEIFCNPNSNSSISVDDFVERDDVWDNQDFKELTNEATKSPVRPKFSNLIKKFSNISQRIDEDYKSIKDDIPLVSVYTTRNVLVRRMLIPDEFLSEEIRATDDYKEQKKVDEGEKDAQSYDDVDDFDNRLEPGSHKENPEYVVDDDDDDDDDKEEEKVDENEGNEMGSLEIRIEKMQTLIPTTPRSPRINLSSDKNIARELTNTVSLSTPTTSKAPHKQRCISSKYNHLPVDRVLYEIVPQIAKRATDDFIENNLKPCIAKTIIEDRDAIRFEVPDLISKEFNSHAPQIIEELFKRYVQNNRKFEKPSTSNTSCKDDAFHSQHHDDHQDDDAPPEGEKRLKRQKTSKSSKSVRGSSSKRPVKDSTTCVSKQKQQQEWDAWVEETIINEDEVIPEDETPELITDFQNVDKRVPTIFDRARMEATLNDMLSNQFKNAEEYAYHLEQATKFIENHIVWESRQEDIR